jgi:hypothetical protein
MSETTKTDAAAIAGSDMLAENFNEDVQLLMWFENGLIPELNLLLLRIRIDPESSEILKQAKEIALKLFAKTNKCKGFHKNNWGMMDGAEDGCGYDSDIECEDCIFCLGDKDPRVKHV